MAKKTIEELVDERIKDAEKMGIAYKATEIAIKKGKASSRHQDTTYVNKDTFTDKDFEVISTHVISDVSHGYGTSQLSINYQNEQVFTTVIGKIESYLPGKWIEEFESLYSRLFPNEEELRLTKEAGLKRRFGL